MGKVISIIGPTASGKSLLCRELQKKTGWPVVKEFDEMPKEIEEEINKDPESLKLQIWFRNQRINAIQKARNLSQNTNVLLDTCFITSEVHISKMKEGLEKDLVMEMFRKDLETYKLPDIIIGIMCSDDQLYKFYKKRNAGYEQADDIFEHYKELRMLYLQLYRKYPQIIKLSTEGLDFNNNEDSEKILNVINNQLRKQEQGFDR